jgi:DNA polymerase III alpha subunit
MQKLKGRWVDDYGVVVFNTDGIIKHLLNGGGLDGIASDAGEDVEQFIRFCLSWHNPPSLQHYTPNTEPLHVFHKKRQQTWFVPESYQKIDVDKWLFGRCSNMHEVARVTMELKLFKERDMYPILRMLIYLVDFMRSHNIVWGVGRGSSVASFCLYLIGIHKINSFKYDLDIREFLK